MYLDGKYALRKDLEELRKGKLVTKLYIEAGAYIPSPSLVYVSDIRKQ